MYLAGDIGGTKTHLALLSKKGGYQPVRQFTYKSQEFSSLDEIIAHFLDQEKIISACFGVAGPIKGNKSRITNLPWEIDMSPTRKSLKNTPVFLINDLVATAYGIQTLEEEKFFVLNQGKKISGNQGLIAAGTGLGEAGLFYNQKDYIPFPSEGGHTDFAPRDDREIRLFLFLKKKYEHVSYERILSGGGFIELYSFLAEEEKMQRDPLVEKALLSTDAAPLISQQGLQKNSEICIEALNLFISIYGGESGNVALKFLSLGGFYIGGGIAPKILSSLASGLFLENFSKKGRFKSLLLDMPVRVILDDNTALRGASFVAMEH